jgi:integrase
MQRPRNVSKGSVRRHGDGWQVRVYAGRVDGRSQYLTRKVLGSEAAAERIAEELADGVAEARRRNGGQRRRSTFGGYLEPWGDRLVPVGGYSSTTAKAWRNKLRTWALPVLDERELDAILPTEIEAIYSKMAAAGRAPNYRRVIHSALVRLFADAEREGLVAMSPMPYVQRPKAKRTRPVAPEADEVIDYLEVAQGPGRPRSPFVDAGTVGYGAGDFGVLLVLAFATGARRGELVGLQLRDVDFARRDVFIRRTVVGDRNDELEVKELKTGEAGEGRVPVDDATLEVLRQFILRREETALAAGGRLRRSSFLFSQDVFGVLPRRPHWATRAMQRLRDREGLEAVTVQGLRRASATVPLDDGVSAAVVAGRLRHDPETMQKHYAGRSAKGRDAAVASLGAVVAEAVG